MVVWVVFRYDYLHIGAYGAVWKLDTARLIPGNLRQNRSTADRHRSMSHISLLPWATSKMTSPDFAIAFRLVRGHLKNKRNARNGMPLDRD